MKHRQQLALTTCNALPTSMTHMAWKSRRCDKWRAQHNDCRYHRIQHSQQHCAMYTAGTGGLTLKAMYVCPSVPVYTAGALIRVPVATCCLKKAVFMLFLSIRYLQGQIAHRVLLLCSHFWR